MLTVRTYDREGNVTKTFERLETTLLTYECEEVIRLTDLDKLMGETEDYEQLGKEVVKNMGKNRTAFKEFVIGLFAGMTEEDYEHTKMLEVSVMITRVIFYTMQSLYGVMVADPKNQQGSVRQSQ